MTNRNRSTNVKIETFIENCRSEGKWQRVIELAEELKVGSPSNYGKSINFFSLWLMLMIVTNCLVIIRMPIEFLSWRR